MFEAKTIKAGHQDLIHDVAYDFHGRRMATCSTDQFVKIWDLENDQWNCTASWKSHSGSVWRVTWAHPEFGQVIATCSFDRVVKIWEELPGDGGEGGKTHWVKRGNLVDSRASVTDVKFAPKHHGLQLATCSVDGFVRIYEAHDVMNLSGWPLHNEINCNLPCSCISWNPSRVHHPMLAVGSDDVNTACGKVQIFEYSHNSRQWEKVETITTVTDSVRDVSFAPNLGRSYHLLAIAAKDIRIITLKPLRSESSIGNSNSKSKFECHQIACFNEHQSQVWRLCWNITGTILASSGDDGIVRLWKGNYLDNWKNIAELRADGTENQKLPKNASLGDSNTSSSKQFHKINITGNSPKYWYN